MHSIKRRMNLTEVTYSKSREGKGEPRQCAAVSPLLDRSKEIIIV